MDASEYLPMFLAECREHLQSLNVAVVRVEENPGDRETVDEIFRIAHSLKGMSATMGFTSMAALAHEMEDAFELMRQRTTPLPQAAIDAVLECLDALEEAIECIGRTGEENLDLGPLTGRLRNLVRGRTAAQERDRRGGRAPVEPAIVVSAQGRRVVRVAVKLADDTMMPSVRAFMVLEALRDHGDLVASAPSEEGLDGYDGRDVEAWLASEHEADAIATTVRDVPDVASAAVAEDDPVAVAGTVEEAAAAAAAAAASAGLAEAAAVPEAAAADGPASPARITKTASVRVDADRLDQLMHAMGELVVHRTRIESLAAAARIPELAQAVQDLTRSSQALQAMVMQVRMIPVDVVFLRLPRLIRDLSSKLDKEVELELVGKETELDRTVVEALGDPLVHLVRNAIDHGIEPPAEREAAGKPRHGRLTISARHAGRNVVIEVADDGRGIDPAKIAATAVERGLATEEAAAQIDALRAAELLFAPGFSTAPATSDVSGRGVGMDVVRTMIRDLGGEVLLTTDLGAGTVAQIRLPLTLAIMAALLVEAGGMPFAIPLDRIQTTVRIAEHPVRSVTGSRMLVLREEVLPLVDAAAALGHPEAGDDDGEYAVVVRGAAGRLALAVSGLIGQRELVTKALPPAVRDDAPVSGGAVLSNGDIALIVDCDALSAGAMAGAPIPA